MRAHFTLPAPVLRRVLLGLIAALAVATPAASQVSSIYATDSLPAVPVIVRTFAEEVVAEEEDEEGRGMAAIEWIRGNSDRVPASLTNALLAALEELALSAPRREVRGAALTELAAFGETLFGGRPRPGVLPRVLRVYRQTDDPALRSLGVNLLSRSSEQPQTAAFLRQVAMQHGPSRDFADAPNDAIFSLSLMGQEGTRVLRELHTDNSVRDPAARGQLRWLAANGYRPSRAP